VIAQASVAQPRALFETKMSIASFWQSLGGIIHAIVGGCNGLVVVTTLQFRVGSTQASTVKRAFDKDIGQGTWDTPIPKGGNDLVPSDWSLAVGTCVQKEEQVGEDTTD